MLCPQVMKNGGIGGGMSCRAPYYRAMCERVGGSESVASCHVLGRGAKVGRDII